jgi:beta-lactamase superfamily II metal-dependent hydrolase
MYGSNFCILRERPAGKATTLLCVLEVPTGRHKLLLTGDIEGPVEATLLQNSLLERVDAVVIPHHGSRTSSSPQFVELLSPELAIVSAGFGNRWGFPKEDAVRRWHLSGARLLDTATVGAISQRICVDSGIEALQLERRESGVASRADTGIDSPRRPCELENFPAGHCIFQISPE